MSALFPGHTLLLGVDNVILISDRGGGRGEHTSLLIGPGK